MPIAFRGALLSTDERDGSPNAERTDWGREVVRHNRALIVALLARGVPLDQAKDLAQLTWARLWERHGKGGLPFIELPGLAIRQALLLRAAERRALRRQEELRLISLPSLVSDPADRYLSRDQLRRIGLELEKLPRSVQEVFRLAYCGEGLSHAQIGERVGLSIERVRHVLCELRRQLRPIVEMGVEMSVETDDGEGEEEA